MKVLGIDPGTASTGWGIVEEVDGKIRPVKWGVVKTSPQENSSQRLFQIRQGIDSLIKEHKPQTVAIEELFFSTNAKTAMKVGEARGVAMLGAAENGVPVAEYKPVEIKMAITGFGVADKKQMQQMVKSLLSLGEIPKPDDAADALAIAICHLHSAKIKNAIERASR